MSDIKVGRMAWSSVLDCNVEVIAIYKKTATVRARGQGLQEGKMMTFRGQSLDSLHPKTMNHLMQKQVQHECPQCGSDLDFYGGYATCPNDDCEYQEPYDGDENI